MTTPWTYRYAHRTKSLTSSAIRELLKLTQNPNVISFAGGLPAPELFPTSRIQSVCAEFLSNPRLSQAALQYSTTEGYPPLRELIARHTARYGINAKPENVLITSGSQQALDLIGKLLINRGDRVLVEAPTYLGALQAFNVFGPGYVNVPMDDAGLITTNLDDLLRTGIKFMYLLPNFQNPSGVTLTLERRQEVVALAEKYGVPIVEDDPYGQLRYEAEHLPTLLVLDRQNVQRDTSYELGNVIYLSTFSKTLAPGLRLGWMVAPTEVINKLVLLKQGADLHTSAFTQVLAHEVAQGGFLDDHITQLRQVYRERRDVMLAALDENFPPAWGVSWTRPLGGLFLWLKLPPPLQAHTLLQQALAENVAFVPGAAFFAEPDTGQHYCRLNFSNAQPALIQEGIRRLATVVKRALNKPPTPSETPPISSTRRKAVELVPA